MPLPLPESVIPLFRAAGWLGSIPEAPYLGLMDHPAAAVLQEFGGISVGQCGAGEECARSDIRFTRDESMERDAFVQEWQALLATRLICIGEIHHGHGALFMDSRGTCYHSSLIHEAFTFEGESFSVAVERILLGRRGRPMLRLGQQSVTLYGDVFTESHPSIYRWRQQIT